jgi:hypothetical protein
LKPFFISIEIAPPSALRPKTGLLGNTSSRRIAYSGMKSQFTVSPKDSLTRTPFWYTARPCGTPTVGDARKPRYCTSGWNGFTEVSLM